MIYHENELINHRLTWLCQIQGFLFAALTATWLPSEPYAGSNLIRSVICVVGILVAFSSWTGLDAAIQAIESLEAKSERIKEILPMVPPINLEPPIMGLSDYKLRSPLSSFNRIDHFFLPWHFISLILIPIWGVILIILWTIPNNPTLAIKLYYVKLF